MATKMHQQAKDDYASIGRRSSRLRSEIDSVDGDLAALIPKIPDSRIRAKLYDVHRQTLPRLRPQTQPRHESAAAYFFSLHPPYMPEVQLAVHGSENAEARRMTMDGIGLIAQERQRQLERGYTPTHDDGHDDGSIAEAAAEILDELVGYGCGGDIPDKSGWPQKLGAQVFRKYGDDPIRRLAIAGALVVAEIERLQRKFS